MLVRGGQSLCYCSNWCTPHYTMMKAHRLLWPLLYLLVTCSCANGLIERLYCGKHNCYELLGIKNTADASEIRKGYRKMAVKYHPDKNKDPGASEMFQLVRTAYEILKDDEERLNYDYLLENPNDVYRHYYRYYKKRVKPKIDVRIVLGVLVLGISAFQWVVWQHTFDGSLKSALQYPKYRQQAIELAKQKGIWVNTQANLTKKDMKKMNKRELKDEMRAEEDAILLKVFRENVTIVGGYRKATFSDLFVAQLVLFPYKILRNICWCMRWHAKFTIGGEPYGPEEKIYLTRERLGLSEAQWEAAGDQVRQDMLRGELWNEKNWEIFKQSQQDQMRAKMAESSRFKMYRRYMKKSRPDYHDDY